MYLKLILLMLLFRKVNLLPEHDFEVEGKINIGQTFLSQIAEMAKDENNNHFRKAGIVESDDSDPMSLDGKKRAGLIQKSNLIRKIVKGSHADTFSDTRRNNNKHLNSKYSTKSKRDKNHDKNRKKFKGIEKTKNNVIISSGEAHSDDDFNKKSKQNFDKLTQKKDNDVDSGSDFKLKRKSHSNKYKNKKKQVVLEDEFETYLNKSSDLTDSEEEAVRPYPSYVKPHATQEKIGEDFKTSLFIEHIIENGKNKIKEVSEPIALKLKVDTDISRPIISASYASYTSKMKSYISYIANQEIKSEIDREYILLDIVTSCNLLLYSEQRKILNIFAENKGKNVSQYEVDLQTEEVFKQYLAHKKQEMFYVCEKLNVCRAYPGFSDYFAEFISDLLKLPDEGLVVVLKNLAKLIKNRTRFFKSFIKARIADAMGKRLQSAASDLDDFKEMLSSVRSIITQRFKLMKTSDFLLKTRTKAVRILIDIIDKTFGLAADDELTVMTFDTAVQALRRWTSGHDRDIALPLKLLMEHIVSVVKHNWDDDILEEISVLTEIIMVGRTKDKEVYKDLFSRGSVVARKYSLDMVDPETQMF